MTQIKKDRAYREQLIERFWAKVNKERGLGPEGKCWEWTGSRHRGDGVGVIAVRTETGKVSTRNPRDVAYELVHGHKLKKGHEVYQTCNNTVCVRDEHLDQRRPVQVEQMEFPAPLPLATALKEAVKSTGQPRTAIIALAVTLGLKQAVIQLGGKR